MAKCDMGQPPSSQFDKCNRIELFNGSSICETPGLIGFVPLVLTVKISDASPSPMLCIKGKNSFKTRRYLS